MEAVPRKGNIQWFLYRYAIFSVQRPLKEGLYIFKIHKYYEKGKLKDFPVARRQDPTRSHPEHGRKDCLR